MSSVAKGTWVEIERILLLPDQRLPEIPTDTRQTPLTMKVCGFLQEDDVGLGSLVTVETVIGHSWQGVLTDIEPEPTQHFGPPVPELQQIAPRLRRMLAKGGG